jgi:hypothetical protein
MRIRAAGALALALALTGPMLRAQTDAAELLKNPKYASSDLKPAFRTLTAEEIRSGVTVTSSRNSAAFGFNNSSLQVHLPRIDNSNWMDAQFTTPKLLDRRGKEVKYEKEQGIYSQDTWSTEIRFAPLDKKPLEFAKATGSVTLKYPRVMKTVSLKKSEKAKAAALGVIIDGPYVKADLAKVPEEGFGSNLEGVRAYDKTGKRLERVMGYTSSSWDNEVSYRGHAYHGEVARVEVDTAEEWIGLQIDYEMPPAPALPSSAAGSVSKPAEPGATTPGGKFTVKIVPVTP